MALPSSDLGAPKMSEESVLRAPPFSRPSSEPTALDPEPRRCLFGPPAAAPTLPAKVPAEDEPRSLRVGPEGGDQGGQVVAKGTPEEVVNNFDSHTAKYLRRVLRKSVKS